VALMREIWMVGEHGAYFPALPM